MKSYAKENPLEVVFLDNHLLVVNKPVGMPTQENPFDEVDLETEAKKFLKKKFQKPGEVFLEAVHRLDKPASGLVLFARTNKALSRLNEYMREKKIKKTYFALVEGFLDQKEGELKHFLIHGDYRAVVAKESDAKAKLAKLHYKEVGILKEKSLLKIRLETGRYHQIRAQLAAIGCPVLGDQKYGAKEKQNRIFLHHGELQFSHPISKKIMKFESRPPFFI